LINFIFSFRKYYALSSEIICLVIILIVIIAVFVENLYSCLPVYPSVTKKSYISHFSFSRQRRILDNHPGWTTKNLNYIIIFDDLVENSG